MRTMILAALAAVVAAPLSGARPNSQSEHTVIGRMNIPTVKTWKARLTNELDHRLATVTSHRFVRDSGDGFAVVMFRCGPDGRAQDINLVQSSNNDYVNRTAMRAISGLRKLHPMPAELKTGQLVRANIVLADDGDGIDRQLRKLRKATSSRTVAATQGERVIVLNAGLGVQG